MVLEHISELLNANSCLPDAVQFKNDKFPEVFLNGIWSPICGHWFWDNYYGAGLFCQKLTSNIHSTGKVIRRTDKPLESDGIRIGKCLVTDQWGSCTGGYNDHEIGQDPGCAAGQPASIEIMCSHGKTESVQLNKYETAQNFILLSQNLTSDCLLIYLTEFPCFYTVLA